MRGVRNAPKELARSSVSATRLTRSFDFERQELRLRECSRMTPDGYRERL